MKNLEESGIYHDLMRKFCEKGHTVFAVYTIERRHNEKTTIYSDYNFNSLGVKTLNIQKAHFIEKTISTFLLSSKFKNAILKKWSGVKFDLIIFSTPPITFAKVIEYFKERDSAKTYLLLKDIFPQNAVDLEMIKKNGLIHRYFAQQEKQLYDISDHIGCMSQGNVNYLNRVMPELSRKTEVNPNSIDITRLESVAASDRSKYSVPENATVFIYGGNLGKPQGIGFLLDVLSFYKDRHDLFFLLVGSGTEYDHVKNHININMISNSLLLEALPKQDFEDLVEMADIGLIFLDHRFTIPNFPSRLLSYLQHKKPVIAATDKNTDIGEVIEKNGFGFWAESGDIHKFSKHVTNCLINNQDLQYMGKNGFNFLLENYSTDVSYNTVMNHFNYRS